MKKVYLIYRYEFDELGKMTRNWVIAVYTNKKKAIKFKDFRNRIHNGENVIYSMLPMEINNYVPNE